MLGVSCNTNLVQVSELEYMYMYEKPPTLRTHPVLIKCSNALVFQLNML